MKTGALLLGAGFFIAVFQTICPRGGPVEIGSCLSQHKHNPYRWVITCKGNYLILHTKLQEEYF
jgi:hypothetical protein